jgi:serine/threonine-protein kinase
MYDADKDSGLRPNIHAARVGTFVKDKWRLDKLLGVGGMASVYAATHRNGKRVAIKILHDELALDTDVRTRFLREGYLANAVDHEGVVSVVDDDITEEGAIFLVMELLEGETLERRLERKARLPVAEALWITGELLDVLAAAHARGILHRDIKPDNVFLTRRGRLKLLDFGIARQNGETLSLSTTQSGATMGTPAYMSPEQARGRWEEVDARSDVWAVGATLFCLLSGRSVHEAATTMNEQLLAAMTSSAPPALSVLPELPPEVAAVLDRALAYRAADRWESANAMHEAIRAARSALEARRPPTPDPDKTDAMPPLDIAALESGTFDRSAVEASEHGIAHSPSAAPAVRALSKGRSMRLLALSAGGLVVAIAFAALVPNPSRVDSIAAAAPGYAVDEPAASPPVAAPPATGVPSWLAAPSTPAAEPSARHDEDAAP